MRIISSMQLLSNLDYPIGDVIKQALQDAHRAQFAVAFLKYSGVDYIERSLEQCLANNGSLEIITGLDFKATEGKALRYFIRLQKQCPRVKLFCFGDRADNKTSIVFHPKIYLFENKKETTGIVGSANLTKGGMTTNFEVNAVFREHQPLYFSQLQAIYNSVKFRGSVFAPNEDYVDGYEEASNALSKNERRVRKDKSIQKLIEEVEQKEATLPGTVPTTKAMIVKIIKDNMLAGQEYTPLSEIYTGVWKVVAEKNISGDFKKPTIRGALNIHEQNSNDQRNLKLFVRSDTQRGHYSLTPKGRDYQGR